MREEYFIGESQLLEAVRRGLISDTQKSEIEALARSAAEARHATASPGLVIIRVLLLSVMLVAPMFSAFASLRRGEIGVTAVSSVVAVSVSLAAFRWLTSREGEAIHRAILGAGAAWWSWGIGAAIGALLFRDAFPTVAMFRDDSFSFDSRLSDLHQQYVFLLGDLAMFSVSSILVVRWRVALAAMPASFAVMFAMVGVVEAMMLRRSTASFEVFDVVVLLAFVLLLLAAGALIDRRTRSWEIDPAFWTQLCNLAPLLLLANVTIERSPISALLWVLVAAGMFFAGVRLDRRSLMIGGGILVFALPYGAHLARLSSLWVALAFSLSAALALALSSTLERAKRSEARSSSGYRSIWAA
jgi:hypothetical protein